MIMSNVSVYERLSTLFKSIKPDAQGDLLLDALLYACSVGIELLKNNFADIENQQYIDTMSQEMIDKYCVLLDVDLNNDLEEKKSKIKKKLSMGYDEFSIDEFIDYYKGYGNGFFVHTQNFNMKLYGVKSSNASALRQIMKRFDYYFPPFVTVELSGEGLTFEEWDSMDMTFQSLESLKMPFSMIETMKL